jgi:hypothetical protein
MGGEEQPLALFEHWVTFREMLHDKCTLRDTEDDVLRSSSCIACLDLRRDLEETVDCSCETRTSVLLNLNDGFFAYFFR